MSFVLCPLFGASRPWRIFDIFDNRHVVVAEASGLEYTFLFGWHVKSEDLTQLVSQLSPAEQSAVKEFITFLKERTGKVAESAFLAAIDEFIAAHPELLRRLSQ